MLKTHTQSNNSTEAQRHRLHSYTATREANIMKGICPECNQSIDYLINIQSGWFEWTYTPGAINEYEPFCDIPENSFSSDDNVNQWQCPECRTIIAYNEEEADKILGVKK